MTAWFHAEYTRRDRFWSFQVLLAHMTLFRMTKMCNLFQSTRKPISYRNEWSLILYIARMIAELKSRYESHPEIEWRHLNVIRSPYWFAGPKSAGFIAFGGKWRKIWKLYFFRLNVSNKMELIYIYEKCLTLKTKTNICWRASQSSFTVWPLSSFAVINVAQFRLNWTHLLEFWFPANENVPYVILATINYKQM